jgi:hypothetical protein
MKDEKAFRRTVRHGLKGDSSLRKLFNEPAELLAGSWSFVFRVDKVKIIHIVRNILCFNIINHKC